MVLALAGCGSTQVTRTTTTQGAGQGPTVRFTGGDLPGTVYLAVGPDDVSLDAYRLSGPLAKTERLTYSPVGLGINGAGVNQHDVVIQRICCGGLNFLEQLDLSRRGGLPGTVLAAGEDPAIAPNGSFAYAVPNYENCRCDALLVRPSLLGPDHVIYRVPHPGEILSVVWSVEDRLAAMIGKSTAGGGEAHTQIVLYPGTREQQIITPAAMVDIQSGLWWGPHNEISYEITGPQAVIHLASGVNRSFLTGDWHPTCWLPNDTIFTVNVLKSTVGTMNPVTGAVTTVGRFPSSAAVFVLDCPH